VPEGSDNRPLGRMTDQAAADGIPDRTVSGRASDQPAIGAAATVRVEALKGADHD
jgi:hypothetical protein